MHVNVDYVIKDCLAALERYPWSALKAELSRGMRKLGTRMLLLLSPNNRNASCGTDKSQLLLLNVHHKLKLLLLNVKGLIGLRSNVT